MLALVFALTPASLASADIEFKSSGPVTIFVDGRQAAQSNPLKHRMSGLESGVHELRVVGMFGKTLYEAEIDLPDNTITYTSWERGEIKVLSTDWLPKEEAIVEDEPSDTGVNDDEQVVVVDPPAEPDSEGVPAAAVPVAAAAGAGVAVAASQEPEPVVEPTAVEPEPPVEDAVAAVEPTSAAAPVEASGVGAAPVVVAAAAVPAAAAASSVAAAPPKPRTLTLQATEGMRIEVLQDGRKVILVYENGVFRIEDETGFSMVLGN